MTLASIGIETDDDTRQDAHETILMATITIKVCSPRSVPPLSIKPISADAAEWLGRRAERPGIATAFAKSTESPASEPGRNRAKLTLYHLELVILWPIPAVALGASDTDIGPVTELT